MHPTDFVLKHLFPFVSSIEAAKFLLTAMFFFFFGWEERSRKAIGLMPELAFVLR